MEVLVIGDVLFTELVSFAAPLQLKNPDGNTLSLLGAS